VFVVEALQPPMQAEAAKLAFAERYTNWQQAVTHAMAKVLTEERNRLRLPESPNPTENNETPLLNPLWEALNHGCLLGGKRFRPLLVLEAYTALSGASYSNAMPVAMAVEMVHAHSLVLDDLPCMDDDAFRRGQPTVHKAYGEALAVLSADALIGLSFGVLKRGLMSLPSPPKPETVLHLLEGLSDVSALQGLVNGQAADLALTGEDALSHLSAEAQIETILYTLRNKTAALLRYSLRVAGLLALDTLEQTGKAPSLVEATSIVDHLDGLGLALGLAFQLVDDALDKSTTLQQLGKTPGKDEAQNKQTLARVAGETYAQQVLEQQEEAVQAHLQALSQWLNPEGLQVLVNYCLQRTV
jgi:geranylgeranyl pyrophosphate synthase